MAVRDCILAMMYLMTHPTTQSALVDISLVVDVVCFCKNQRFFHYSCHPTTNISTNLKLCVNVGLILTYHIQYHIKSNNFLSKLGFYWVNLKNFQNLTTVYIFFKLWKFLLLRFYFLRLLTIICTLNLPSMLYYFELQNRSSQLTYPWNRIKRKL